MLKKNFPIQTIIDLLEVTKEQVLKIQKELKKKKEKETQAISQDKLKEAKLPKKVVKAEKETNKPSDKEK